MKFTKMQGLGNDFVFFEGHLELKPVRVKIISDRKRGVGSDGVIVVSKISANYVKMDYWNADGSIAEMCGNGLRCTARFAYENDMVSSKDFVVQTLAGDLKVSVDLENTNMVKAQIGKVIVDEKSVMLHGKKFYTANVGNPHAITFVDSVSSAPVKILGPIIENDKYFPNKTNVEFVHIDSKDQVTMRIWERGVGETEACGTAMVAVAAVCAKVSDLVSTDRELTVLVPGGQAKISVDTRGYSVINAPAEFSFEGDLDLQGVIVSK